MEQAMSIRNKLSSMHSARRAQRGAVMVVALIFLLLLTILAISASGRSLLQERMAGGLRNAQQANMSAQTALRGAEWRLWTSTSNLGEHLTCGSGVFTDCYIYDPASPITNVVNFRTRQGWVTTGSTEYKGYDDKVDFTAADHGQLAQNPHYIIEDLGLEQPPGVSGGMHESGATGAGGTGYASTSRHIYRITARATGGSENTVRVLESTFAAKSN
jgi:type IV pilus assembly protein PilX